MTDHPSPNQPAFELPPNRSRIGRAVDDELAFHIGERARELVASGIDARQAHAQAAAEFGDLEAARADLRRIDELAARRSWAVEALADLWTDARRTARSLIRRPAYALVATITLALGIGANSAMFALVDRLLLSAPPHIRDADEVVRLRFDEAQRQSGRITWVGAPYDFYRALTGSRPRFDVAGSTALTMSMRVTTDTRAAAVVATTPRYFTVLGVQPAVGRFLADGDAADERSAVISHSLWSRELGRAPDAVGRDITLGVETFRVVGVAPRGFTGDGIEPVDAWIALGTSTPGLPRGWMESQTDRRVSLIVRPQPGTPPGATAAEATRHYLAWRASTPAAADSTARVLLGSLVPGRTSAGGITPESRVALWLQAVSVLVLLIAVANVANLLLLRAIDRRRETAVSMALGVSRIRLVRSIVLESLWLGGASAILATLLTRWVGPFLWRVLLPDGAEPSVTPWRDAAIIAALAVGSALAMTIVPALLQLRTSTIEALRNGARGASRRGTRAGDLLVVVQVACAVVLLVGSGLFVKSLLRVSALDLGFQVDQVLAVQVDHGQTRADTAAVGRFLRIAEERVRGVAGVSQTATSLTAPYRPSMTMPVFLPGRDELPGVGQNALGYPSFFAVSPEFFATMGLAILRGRDFAVVDAPAAPPVAIVDATMAKTFWPDKDALGQCFRVGADTAPCRTVVAVVEDSKRALTARTHALRYYLPLSQMPTGTMQRFLFVRTAGSPKSMIAPVRAAVVGAAAVQPLIDVFPMSQLLDPYTRPWRLGRAVFVAFGVLATLIATIGLYGVIAFGVEQRRRELGIRIALGAPRSRVLRSVMLGAGGRMAIGCVVGAAGAFVLGRRLHDLLFQTSPTDALVFGAALSVVMLATLVACALPAWRAVRVDPTVSLRAE
jgi:predicted permease